MYLYFLLLFLDLFFLSVFLDTYIRIQQTIMLYTDHLLWHMVDDSTNSHQMALVVVWNHKMTQLRDVLDKVFYENVSGNRMFRIDCA